MMRTKVRYAVCAALAASLLMLPALGNNELNNNFDPSSLFGTVMEHYEAPAHDELRRETNWYEHSKAKLTQLASKAVLQWAKWCA